MKRKAPTFTVGDRIAYGVAFLKSTGQTTGEVPQMRMTVTEVFEPPVSDSAGCLIHFTTDRGTISGGLACNFTLVSRIGTDSALNT